jgi:hypothetical protein
MDRHVASLLAMTGSTVIATATPASGLAVTAAWQSISWFVIASEAWQSMDRHVASLLAMTGGAVIASEARQSMDRHVASLLAMTQEFFASLLAMTKKFVTSLLTMTGLMGQPQRCQSFSQPGGRLILVAMTGGNESRMQAGRTGI